MNSLPSIVFRRSSRPGLARHSLGLLACALLTAFAAQPQTATAAPANDNFANSTAITNKTGSIAGSNIGATYEPGEPDPANVAGGRSVWYTWTAPISGTVAFTTGGSNYDTVMGVYTGNSVSTLALVGANDDGRGLSSQVVFVAQAGARYRILVDGFAGASGTFILSWLHSNTGPAPIVNAGQTDSGTTGSTFSFQVGTLNQPTSFSATGLPPGLSIDATGLISGSPVFAGAYTVTVNATNAFGTGTGTVTLTITAFAYPRFFANQVVLGNGVRYLEFVGSGTPFGYYSYLNDAHYIYHFDLGFEYVIDATDHMRGIYLYDFASSTFFYTDTTFPFPYMYDFTLNTVVYYFPDTSNPGHYTTNPRYFYRFDTGEIFTK